MMIVSTRASDEQVFLVVANGGAATSAADGYAFHGSSDHQGKSARFDSELNEERKREGQSSNAKIMRKEFDHPREKANSRTKDIRSKRWWCERWQAWLFAVGLLASRSIQSGGVDEMY